jgi:hypothetical protein
MNEKKPRRPATPSAAPDPQPEDPDEASRKERVEVMNTCVRRAFSMLDDIYTYHAVKVTSEAVAIVAAELFRSEVGDRCTACGGDCFKPWHKCHPDRLPKPE